MIKYFTIFLLFVCMSGHTEDKVDPKEAFYEAIRVGNIAEVRETIRNGFDLNSSNNSDFTPVCWAVLYGRLDIVKLFVESGANPNHGKNPALTCLAAMKHKNEKEIVEYLLSTGADINLPRYDDLTPLLLAVMHGSDEMVELLVLKGANLNYVSKGGKTALDWAVFLRRGGTEEFLKVHGAIEGYGPRLGNRNATNDFMYFFLYVFHPAAIVVFLFAFVIKQRTGALLSPFALAYSAPMVAFFIMQLPNLYFKTMLLPLLFKSMPALLAFFLQFAAYSRKNVLYLRIANIFTILGFLSLANYYLLLIASLIVDS